MFVDGLLPELNWLCFPAKMKDKQKYLFMNNMRKN